MAKGIFRTILVVYCFVCFHFRVIDLPLFIGSLFGMVFFWAINKSDWFNRFLLSSSAVCYFIIFVLSVTRMPMYAALMLALSLSLAIELVTTEEDRCNLA